MYYLLPLEPKMKKARTRVIFAFIFLALVQIACGCSIEHTVDIHVYQDFNGNSTQDDNEPDFPGIDVPSATRIVWTDQNGNVEVKSKPNEDCSDYWPSLIIPPGYTMTEDSQNPSSWIFNKLAGSRCPGIFIANEQEGDWTVGLQPTFEMTKTPDPTNFSAPGETITYTYLINNITDNDFSQVSVTDDKTTVTCPAETVAAGESMTCTATYSTNEQDVAQGSITNTAQFIATVTLFGRSSIASPSYSYDLIITSAPVSATVTLETAQDVEVTCECDGTTEVCSDGSETANAEACASPPAFSGPLLTGEVLTLCDTINRPFNLRLVENADIELISTELTNGNLMVSIGGTDISSTCGVNPSNATLLNCTYPAGINSYPSPGLLTYNGNQIDSFDFYGENDCTPPPSTGGDTTNGEPDTQEEPDTCDPTQPGTPCFCEQNPDDESCITSD